VDNPQQLVATFEQTALAESLHGAAIEQYCGALTIPFFDGTRVETHALLASCGVFDLGYSSLIRVSGADRVRWLNGMVTNSAQGLEAGARNYNFVLNAQGRIQGDLFAYRRADDFVLTTTRDQRDTLLAWFDRYIIMDDVELTPLDAALAVIGIAGPSTAAVLESVGISPGLPTRDRFTSYNWNGTDITVCRAGHPLVPRYEIWINPSEVASLWTALTEAGAVRSGAHAVEMLRILSGTPRYGVDIRGRDLPQETNQTDALHFAKGCYLGQEIVERIRSRGAVHRSFTGFELEGEKPGSGTSLTIDEKPLGELTSVASLSDGRLIALGYARRELIEQGATFHYEGGIANATSLPFQLSQGDDR
jgi:folate-binding protein YgfZ